MPQSQKWLKSFSDWANRIEFRSGAGQEVLSARPSLSSDDLKDKDPRRRSFSRLRRLKGYLPMFWVGAASLPNGWVSTVDGCDITGSFALTIQ
jgi:hypothetical protein